MNALLDLLRENGISPALDDAAAAHAAGKLRELSGAAVYPSSIVSAGGALFFLAQRDQGKQLGCLAQTPTPALQGERRDVSVGPESATLTLGPLSSDNLNVLRARLPWLTPRAVGLQKSIGCEDRFGGATVGHLRSIKKSAAPSGDVPVAAVLVRRSMRESDAEAAGLRNLLDEAAWGVFQEGWRHGFGADADHLTTTADIDRCAEAGYTFFTVDASSHVDDSAYDLEGDELYDAADALPWDGLDDTLDDLIDRLAGRAYDLGGSGILIGQGSVARASVKYGRAVAHLRQMSRHLQSSLGARSFDLELSVAEGELATSVSEHIYLGSEIQRLGIPLASLALRFVGRFEDAVDYIGSLEEFAENFQKHVAVARMFGPYKLSLHAGADKFSLYPIAAQIGGDLIHLKTTGASSLETLRSVAGTAPDFFRDLLRFAREQYAEDRGRYRVSAETDKLPDFQKLSDEQLPGLLDDFHARQMLHVSLAAVMNEPRFRQPLLDLIRSNEERHYRAVETHFDRHLAPFLR